jgi:hypothetical protein
MSTSSDLTGIICSQRQLYLNYTNNIPKNRIEPISPYPEYTQEQLNMRRKVEILKYNRQSNMGNNLTKNGSWAKLNKKTTSRQHSLKPCPKIIRPTPTTSSDVPGPTIYLLEDDSVPLYHYATVEDRKLPIVPDSANNAYPILSEIVSNIVSANNTETIVCNLAIVNPENVITTFQFQTPVSFSITGTKTQLFSGITPVSSIQVKIASILYTTYYLGSPVSNTILHSPIIQTIPIQNEIMIIDVSGSNNDVFSATQYIDNLTVSSIQLITQTGTVYSLQLLFTLEYSFIGKTGNVIIDNANITDVNLSTIVNLSGNPTSSEYFQNTSNCKLISNPGNNFQPFSIDYLQG